MAGRTDELRARLLAAVDVALGGDWEAAHLVAQDHEGDTIANWLHAVVHRMEGDEGNARYWYRRCGKDLRPEVSTAAELGEIRSELEKADLRGGEARGRPGAARDPSR